MTLTVEDGTGREDANALISVAYADTYHSELANATWTGATDDKEAAIRRASALLTNGYRWQGNKVNGRDQTMAWPRYDVVDEDGYAIASDAVPREIQQACAEIALAELVTPGVMTPTVVLSDRVKSERVGPLSVEYQNARTDAGADRPVLLAVGDLVGRFLSGSSSGLFGRSERA